MNLRARFLWLTSILFLCLGLTVWFVVRQLSVNLTEQWAASFAEKQVLYDKSRLLQPIQREIALSKQLTESTVILQWAKSPGDEALMQASLQELENFRVNFRDKNYFYALKESGRYYHNNAANEYADAPFRYTLDPENPNDRWFYEIIEQNRDLHLNVNPDVELGITMLWIDMLVRDGENVLAVAGTGLDLTEFLNNIVDTHEPGISTVFTDHNGAIQLFREQDRIAFASVVAASEGVSRNPLDGLFDTQADASQIWGMMQGLDKFPNEVLTEIVSIKGRRHIVGVAYLPEIDWYELTLMDLDVILPFSQFRSLVVSFVLILLLSLIVIQFALRRYVLNPLGSFENSIEEMREGKEVTASLKPVRKDEIGRLMVRFNEMSESVSTVQRELEEKVKQRTEQLEVLSVTDALTDLLNRRGLNQRLDEALNQFQREGKAFGLIWLDMDNFKRINDQLGHDVGDACLKMVAEEIKRVLRPYDSASRWGGDEFMLMISNTDEERIKSIAERLLLAVRGLPEHGDIRLSITVSSCVIQQGETLQNAMKRADEAMYRGKEAGRDRHFAAKRS